MNYYELQFYVDAAGEWRWRIVAPNGKIIGASTEGYVNEQDCRENVVTLLALRAIKERVIAPVEGQETEQEQGGVT